MPRGDSPQLCTVIKGQLLKPSDESSSTLRPSNVEFVPIGEVKNICKFPRYFTLTDTFDCTCSRKLISFSVFIQASVYI